jgi:hypothetical protein
VDFLYHISLPVLATISVGFAVALSLGGLALFHHFADKNRLHESHDVVGPVYSVMGTIYAVLMAFVVIVVWEQYRTADQIADGEAMHLSNVRQLSKALPDSISKLIAADVKDYSASVIEREWPAMAEGHADSATYGITKRLWNRFYSYRPAPADQEFYNEALQELMQFNNSRRERVLDINGSIPAFLWTLLLSGGIICIVFTYLFATPRPWTQYVITGLLAAMIGVTLFLIFEMDHPYRGGMSLDPDAFEFVLHGPAK